MIERIFMGTTTGGATAAVSQAGEEYSALVGFGIFTLGILVGLAGAVIADIRERKTLRLEYEEWIAKGRPERRAGARLGSDHRKAR